jgi:hypothetical protein
VEWRLLASTVLRNCSQLREKRNVSLICQRSFQQVLLVALFAVACGVQEFSEGGTASSTVTHTSLQTSGIGYDVSLEELSVEELRPFVTSDRVESESFAGQVYGRVLPTSPGAPVTSVSGKTGVVHGVAISEGRRLAFGGYYPPSEHVVPESYKMIAMCDFNGDGSNDILWRDNSPRYDARGNFVGTTGTVGLWYIFGNQLTLAKGISVPLPLDYDGQRLTGWRVMACGRFSGAERDSATGSTRYRSSVLFRNDATGELALWKFKADGEFDVGTRFLDNLRAPLPWRVTDVFDTDRDGIEEVLLVGPGNVVGLWRMGQDSILSGHILSVSCDRSREKRSVVSTQPMPDNVEGVLSARMSWLPAYQSLTVPDGYYHLVVGRTALLPNGSSASTICGRALFIGPTSTEACDGPFCRSPQ